MDNHINKYIIISLILLVVYGFGASWLIYSEVTTTYADTYRLLGEAGIDDVMSLPETFNYRIIIMLTIIPLMGVSLLLPLCLRIAKDVRTLIELHSG